MTETKRVQKINNKMVIVTEETKGRHNNTGMGLFLLLQNNVNLLPRRKVAIAAATVVGK